MTPTLQSRLDALPPHSRDFAVRTFLAWLNGYCKPTLAIHAEVQGQLERQIDAAKCGLIIVIGECAPNSDPRCAPMTAAEHGAFKNGRWT